jgi:hypothetical protein
MFAKGRIRRGGSLIPARSILISTFVCLRPVLQQEDDQEKARIARNETPIDAPQ